MENSKSIGALSAVSTLQDLNKVAPPSDGLLVDQSTEKNTNNAALIIIILVLITAYAGWSAWKYFGKN